jgi:hypothetical protein
VATGSREENASQQKELAPRHARAHGILQAAGPSAACRSLPEHVARFVDLTDKDHLATLMASATFSPSFRGDAKRRTRNLEIPGSR